MNFSFYPNEFLEMELMKIKKSFLYSMDEEDFLYAQEIEYNIISEMYKRKSGLSEPSYRSLNWLSFFHRKK
jgi:hypothetical protein